MHCPRSARIVVAGLLAILSFDGVARAGVSVRKHAVEFHLRTFDPADPPKEMPKLQPGEAACTAFTYRCQIAAQSDNGSVVRSGDGFDATVRITDVQVTLDLKVIIWLPKDPKAKLTAHEQGHRQIVESVYNTTGEKIAREAAENVVGTLATGHGRSADAAARAARQAAAQLVGDEYNQRVNQRGISIGNIYDELTAHGTRIDPAEPEAIKRAFERYDHQPAADPDDTNRPK